ncbi:sulfotransferase-like domain-containing protein [Pseudomonas sp. SDO524_S393]
MNRMVGLWAHPRSRSTVLERVFIERGDFEVFHEPFAHMAFSADSAIPSDEWDPGFPTTYAGIKEHLLQAKESRHVFHKDMCYHCLDDLKVDLAFLAQQDNIFLIREPASSIISHYRVHPDMPMEAIGHKALYEIFCVVTKLTGKVPYVINADDLAADPERVIRKLCDYLNIQFLPHAMTWKRECPEQWKTWRRWHEAAEHSERIVSQPITSLDRDIFSQVPKLKAMYDYHRTFYARMNEFCQ